MDVIGVDVGTSSVRLAIIRFYGESNKQVKILASHNQDIDVHQDGFKYEQSSKQIWDAICYCCRVCLAKADIPPHAISGIGFSATCSLVVVDENDTSPLDVIMWMDHRARDVAKEITDSKANVLRVFGGTCSPEFSLSKLIWLKKNNPSKYNQSSAFLELPDWLVFKCTGELVEKTPRSICCMTCKWGYDASDSNYFEYIKEQCDPGIFDRIGHQPFLKPGSFVGKMTDRAKMQLGLVDIKDNSLNACHQVSVAASLIDAHAGMLAMLSTPLALKESGQVEGILCSLAGTSTCHMALSERNVFTPGIWGPYKDVILDSCYLYEAGQTMTGSLIEYIIITHEEGKKRLEKQCMKELIAELNVEAAKMMKPCALHILPSFHGNRCPLANPRLKGCVYGLDVEKKSLLDYYVATIEALAYETRYILESLKHLTFKTVLVSGGLMKNDLYMQTTANVLNMKVVKMSLKTVDFMVMGAGLIARQGLLSTENKELSKAISLRDSIDNLEYDQLETRVFESSYTNRDEKYYNKRYKSYRVIVDASQEIDSIMHDDY